MSRQFRMATLANRTRQCVHWLLPACRASKRYNRLDNAELDRKSVAALQEVFLSWLMHRLPYRGAKEIEEMLLGSVGEKSSPIPRIPPPPAAGCGKWECGAAFAANLLHPWLKEAVPLWLATKHKYPAGQACGILESRRLARRIVRASRLVKELATKYPLNR